MDGRMGGLAGTSYKASFLSSHVMDAFQSIPTPSFGTQVIITPRYDTGYDYYYIIASELMN